MKYPSLFTRFSFFVSIFFVWGCGTQCPQENKLENVSSARIKELTESIKSLSPEGRRSMVKMLFKANYANYKFAPKQLFVKFRDETSASKISSVLSAVDPNTKRLLQTRSNQALLVEIPSVDSDENLLAIAAALTEVESIQYVHPNSLIKAITMPNDPLFSAQPDLHNTGENGLRLDADIDAPEAWDVTTGSSSVVVGIIDTGVDYTHPDLAANMWINPGEMGLDSLGRDKKSNGVDDDGNGYVDDFRGWDFANNDNDPMDDHGHGTHVAGTIGAVGNNEIGISGVAWEVKMVPLKFISAAGWGYLSDAVRAIEYANMMNIPITSNSWGGGGFEPTLEAAIRAGGEKGFLFVAAAGNDSSDNDQFPHYPSNYNLPNVISVAAVDSGDQLASFSNFGATTVHVAAPGVSILSTLPGNQYGRLSGTSMATPHVTGVAALLKAKFPESRYSDLKDRILSSANRMPSLTGKVVSGRLNALNAFETDTTPPQGVEEVSIRIAAITRLEVQWKPSGDDSSTGQASYYQVRMSPEPIDTQSKWESATIANFQTLSQGSSVSNSPVIVRIVDLPINSKGFLSVRAFDNRDNISALGVSVPFKLATPMALFESNGEQFNGIQVEPEESWGQEEDTPDRGHVFSDSPRRLYDNSSESALILPPITINYPDVILSLATKISCEAGFDWAYIEYLKNNETLWKELASYSATGCNWANLNFQLGEKVRANDVLKIRFRFKTNESGIQDGWLIDDIKVLGIKPPEAPSNFVGQLYQRGSGVLSWRDNSTTETHFEIAGSAPAILKQDTNQVILESTSIPRDLRIRACNGPLCSDFVPVTILAAPPEVMSLNPKSINKKGGTLTLFGSGFKRSTQVMIGDKPCGQTRYLSSQIISCAAPAQAEGNYAVRVKNEGPAFGQIPASLAYECFSEASGGEVSEVQVGSETYRVHTLLSSGDFTVSQNCQPFEVLVVAGGGGGGLGLAAGGGGAGGVIHKTNFRITSSNIGVKVGSGGGAGQAGQDSSFGSEIAVGGGQGGNGEGRINRTGGKGGSGGGGGFKGGVPGGAGTPGQGFAGGSSRVGNWTAGGGGGGAGGAGFQGTGINKGVGGSGGAGVSKMITGTNKIFAAGGGGCGQREAGQGGLGGGGMGGKGSTSGFAGSAGSAGSAGFGNTGSGGGGCGGAGGSGVVIVRYRIQ